MDKISPTGRGQRPFTLVPPIEIPLLDPTSSTETTPDSSVDLEDCVSGRHRRAAQRHVAGAITADQGAICAQLDPLTGVDTTDYGQNWAPDRRRRGRSTPGADLDHRTVVQLGLGQREVCVQEPALDNDARPVAVLPVSQRLEQIPHCGIRELHVHIHILDNTSGIDHELHRVAPYTPVSITAT
jgi:hypothetical protein